MTLRASSSATRSARNAASSAVVAPPVASWRCLLSTQGEGQSSRCEGSGWSATPLEEEEEELLAAPPPPWRPPCWPAGVEAVCLGLVAWVAASLTAAVGAVVGEVAAGGCCFGLLFPASGRRDRAVPLAGTEAEG